MIGKFLRQTLVMVTLVSLTLTSALQFTHDLQHEKVHHCQDGSSDSPDHHGDLCALCWFVTHQLSSEFTTVTYLPEACEQILYTLSNNSVQGGLADILSLMCNGRAPPSSSIFLG